jgi:hypothetical protein
MLWLDRSVLIVACDSYNRLELVGSSQWQRTILEGDRALVFSYMLKGSLCFAYQTHCAPLFGFLAGTMHPCQVRLRGRQLSGCN